MLTFMRNKIVGVEKPEGNTYITRGFLDDHIYSLQIELVIEADSLTIRSMQGNWNRHTTPDCPRALEHFSAAKGLRLEDQDFDQVVHKVIGRQACRHFANLILECCDSVKKAKYMEERGPQPEQDAPPEPAEAEAAKPQDTAPAPAAVSASAPKADYQALADAPDGFFIDLHVHTSPASPCASSSVEEVIAEAKRIGLDAICLTDHNYLWDAQEVERLRQLHGLIILRGNEVTTVQGDMVVFGLENNIEGIVTLDDLHAQVAQAGGFIIAAHPFRGFLAVSGDQLGMEVEKAAARPMFQKVNALEGMNSKVTNSENDFSARTAQALGLPATGGSDAHLAHEVGIFATRFDKKITNESELIAALASGQYEPVPYRAQRETKK